MDRVVLRAPTAERERGSASDRPASHLLIVLLSAVGAYSVVAPLFATDGDDEPSAASPSWLLPSLFINNLHQPRNALVIVCVVATIGVYFFLTFFSRRRFLEAVVEISPAGAHLVSIYGQRNKASSCDDIDESGVHHRVRALLPRQRILDVVVTEVVWPHCVWSQVAFRVLDGNIGHSLKETQQYYAEGGKREEAGGNADVSEPSQKNVQQKAHQSSPQPSPAKTPSMQKLLEQNRVSIIPAFPEECRGMLTYKQCLRVQAEIEKFLDQ